MVTSKEQMQIYTFTFPLRIKIGIGALNNLEKWIKKFKSKAPFIIYKNASF